jgi:membrane-associated phospholipid phosphatase
VLSGLTTSIQGIRVVSLVALAVFVALAAAVGAGVAIPADRAIYLFLHGHDNTAIGSVADFLAGRAIEVAGAGLVAAVLLVQVVVGRVWVAALLAASLVPLLARPTLRLTPGLSDAFDRRQPPSIEPFKDWTFPSGHATGSMAIAAVAVLVAWPTRWRKPVLLAASSFVAAVGLAAVSGGQHWPSDVVAGWALTLAWVTALYSLAPGRFAGLRRRAPRC